MLSCVAVSFAQQKAGQSIFEYKKELSLTDDQEKNLHDIITKLQSYLADRSKEIDGLRAELNKMIVDKADLYKIKAKLRAIAQILSDSRPYPEIKMGLWHSSKGYCTNWCRSFTDFCVQSPSLCPRRCVDMQSHYRCMP